MRRPPLFVGRPPLGIPFTLNRASSQAAGLLTWWPTLGQGGAVLFDRVGPHHGTFYDNTAVISNADLGRVISFDGAGDRIEVPHAASLSPTHKTVSAWVILRTVGSPTQTILKKNSDYILRISNNSFQWFVWTDGGFKEIFGGSAVTNTLFHVCGTWNGTTGFLYVNGVQIAQSTPGGTTSTSTETVGLGAQPGGGENLQGELSDIRIYNRALTAAEVWRLYAPATRWDLYQALVPRLVYPVPVAPDFRSRLALLGVG